MNKLSLAYFGTPDFSARLLEKILKDKQIPVEIKLVVTQPDKKVGRGRILTPSPVKTVAQQQNIPVGFSMYDFFSKNRGKEKKSTSSNLNIDLALLFAYGEIIPKEVLEAPKYGFWNIHPSLLPKYRGASPVAYPLINGDKKSGVTLIQMDEKMDHGPIVIQKKVAILPKEKRDELTKRLTDIAFELFKQKITELAVKKKVDLRTQSEQGVSYTKLLTKQDGFISFDELKNKIKNNSPEIFNKFRGLYPWPGLWTNIEVNGQKKRLKITDLDLVNGKLLLKKVQLEGKKETDFEQFKKAYL